MIIGSTIIFNDDYISEIKRHRDNIQRKLDNEVIPDAREELQEKYKFFDNKLEEAMDFQDVASEFINIDVPRIAAVRTISGAVLPLRNVQVL